jgi:hypothetical protein
MLGYELKDLNKMINAIKLAKSYVPENKARILTGLDSADDLLQGLWAEGYFD